MRTTLRRFMTAALLIGVAVTSMAQNKTDEIAVIVNGENIYAWEIAILLPQVQAEMAAQGVDPKGEAVIRTSLERAIDSRLLAQEAIRRGMEPNTSRVDEKMNRMAGGATGRAKLEADLIKSGITYEQLRSTVRQADLVQTLVESEASVETAVTLETVTEYYNANPELFKNQDKIHARHILFKVKADDSPERKQTARDKAVAAHERAVAGEDFAALAIELSEGPNASKGGDLGYTVRGQMVESFDDAVWSLEVGEISDVVESHLGYHVIKVEDILIGPTVPLEEARPAIEDLLRQQRIGVVISELVTELKASAEIRNPEL